MVDRLFDEYFGSTVMGGFAVLVSIIYLLFRKPSPTTEAMFVAAASSGLAMITCPLIVDRYPSDGFPLLARVPGVFIAGVMAGSAWYLKAAMDGGRPHPRAARVVRLAVATALALGVVSLVVTFTVPGWFFNDFAFALGSPGYADRPEFWAVAGFWLLVVIVFVPGWLVLSRQDLDPGEDVRSVANAVGSGLLVGCTVLPYHVAVLTFGLGCASFLYGMFRYFAAQGELSGFLAQFLSPQVSHIVREGGLAAIMQPQSVTVSAVCCDLRGFTAYAEAVPSQAVIDLLSDYYAAVGTAVAEIDGTIKDYAGDGILVLVGAPLSRDDHAEAALELAQRILDVTRSVLERWATGAHPLGIGVGVASGKVTAGAIGSAGRMEYTAVGTPINLAARLCSTAAAGEVLVDRQTADLAGSRELLAREHVQLKGIRSAVPVFQLPT